MELIYSLNLKDEIHKFRVKCECGNCSLLSTKQLNDLREKASSYFGQDSPEIIIVICN